MPHGQRARWLGEWSAAFEKIDADQRRVTCGIEVIHETLGVACGSDAGFVLHGYFAGGIWLAGASTLKIDENRHYSFRSRLP